MENIQHIHEVLHMLFYSEKEYTVEELLNDIKVRFGEDVQFANCAENVFPLQEVVPFLLSRNKIRLAENRIIPLTPACEH